MDFEITDAKYIKEYLIQLRFADGSTGIANLEKYIDETTVFKSFKNLEYFKKFTVEYGTLVWGGGAIDIAPETMKCLQENC